MAAGALLTSMINTGWLLYLTFGVMIGIGVGTSYAPTVSTVSRWFIRKKSVAISIVVAGLGLGTFVFSPLARIFIENYGWRNAFVCFGFIILVVYMFAALIIRRQPSDLNFMAYGKRVENNRYVVQKQYGKLSGTYVTHGLNTIKALNTAYFWILFFVHCFWVCGMAIPMVHLIPHATDLGIDAEKGAVMLGVLGGISVLGRLVLGGLGERYGIKNLLVMVLILQSATMIWLSLSNVSWMLWSFALCFGFTYGGVASMIPLMTAEYFGLVAMGSIFGLILLGATLGGVIGPWVAGLMFDVTNNYFWGFIIGAASMITSVLLTICLPAGGVLRQLQGSH